MWLESAFVLSAGTTKPLAPIDYDIKVGQTLLLAVDFGDPAPSKMQYANVPPGQAVAYYHSQPEAALPDRTVR
jgi:hypothetical protein